jgi:replicative DNA helicase
MNNKKYDSLDLSILKTIITNKQHALDFANECEVKLFDQHLWRFANLVIQNVKNYKDVPTLKILQETKDGTKDDYINDIWKDIQEYDYDLKEYKHDLEKLKKRYADQKLISLVDRLSKDKDKSFDAAKFIPDISKTVSEIKSLKKGKSFEQKTLKESLPEFVDEYNAKKLNPEISLGILTGYKALDDVTFGLQGGELLIIGGESNSGKSMLLMNMAVNMWMQKNTIETRDNFDKGYNVLYFSLEMPFKPCRNRVLSRMANVPTKKLRSSKLSKPEQKQLKTALDFIDKYPYEFEIVDMPRGSSVEKVERVFEESCNRLRPDIVVLDYLSLMGLDGATGKEDDWLALGLIAGHFHEFLRVHNIVGLSAVQLNRMKSNSKDADEKIGLHRIGRSALIMTHANIGIQIETRQNEKQYPDFLWHLIKSRESELTKGKMIKNLACGSLIDDPPIENDDENGFVDLDDVSEKAELLGM